jgi:hypothetical protein
MQLVSLLARYLLGFSVKDKTVVVAKSKTNRILGFINLIGCVKVKLN